MGKNNVVAVRIWRAGSLVTVARQDKAKNGVREYCVTPTSRGRLLGVLSYRLQRHERGDSVLYTLD